MRLFDYPKVSKLMEEAGIHLKGGIHCQRQVEMSYSLPSRNVQFWPGGSRGSGRVVVVEGRVAPDAPLEDGLPLRPAPSRWWVWQRLRVWENDCFGEVSELRPWAETTRRSPGAVCPALPMKFGPGSGR